MNNFDELFENDQDGRFVQFIKKFGTSFILIVSALLSVSFYVTAGVAVFGWMPQEWMAVTSAIILGLTGNELAVSFWLSVRSRAKNITETQATVVGAGIAAGAVTSTLTTLASFIVTPETSPAFLAAYSDVIAFTMMSIPVIIQTVLVMLFLAFTREAEIATSKAKAWGEDLSNMITIGTAMSKATAYEKQQEVRRQLPAYAQEVGQHGARKLVDRGLGAVRAEQEGMGLSPEPVTVTFDTSIPPAPQREMGYSRADRADRMGAVTNPGPVSVEPRQAPAGPEMQRGTASTKYGGVMEDGTPISPEEARRIFAKAQANKQNERSNNGGNGNGSNFPLR